MPDVARFLIIGAGPCGLGAATHLQAQGERGFAVLEASAAPGGLAGSFRDPNGFTWDLGSHLHYSRYERVDRCWDLALGPDQWVQHQRSTWVWLADRFVPYPLQLNLHHLPDRLKEDCLRGLLAAADNKSADARDFRSWILGTFGRGIARCFMLPYNAKQWGYPLGQMSSQWIGQRVAVPDVADLLRRVEREEDCKEWGAECQVPLPEVRR